MTKQRGAKKRVSIGKMSFFERSGLLFGVVGLLADGVALLAFATGVSSLPQVLPKSIPFPSASLLFAITSGLIIIYGWFALAWYLVRRSFVLLGQMPLRSQSHLQSRTTQTVIGLGIIIIPLAIAWSLVNLPDNLIKRAAFSSTDLVRVTATPPVSSSTEVAGKTVTPPPVLYVADYRPKTDEKLISSGWTSYMLLCFPVFFGLFGFIVWLPIVLLMPIVHVELLLGQLSPSVLNELREYFEEE